MIRNNRNMKKRGIGPRSIPLGCWAIGGPFMRISDSGDCGIDDAESARTIHRAVGAKFFTIG